MTVSAALRRRFGRSLKLRSVSAGGCNGCELEVNALTNVNFDIGRYGIDIVASPRHADGLVLTGPVTRNMAEALQPVLGRHARTEVRHRGGCLRDLRQPVRRRGQRWTGAFSNASRRPCTCRAARRIR